MDTPTPVLYILVRDDMDSLNCGKAIAQGSHAANAFVYSMNNAIKNGGDSFVPDLTPTIRLFGAWQNTSVQGFGTVLVLAVNEREMQTAVTVAKVMGFAAETVLDETYPLRDGATTHFLPVEACAYVFGDKDDEALKAVVGNFPLHP